MPNNPQNPAKWRAEQERVLKEAEQLVNLYGECLHQYQTHHLEDGNSVDTWYVCQLCGEETYFPKPYEQVRLGIELVTQYRAYAEACGQIAALLEEDRWIPVEERLPEMDMELLMYSCTGKVISGEWRSGEWEDDAGFGPLRTNYITHWRPLPAPPAPASAEGGAE